MYMCMSVGGMICIMGALVEGMTFTDLSLQQNDKAQGYGHLL